MFVFMHCLRVIIPSFPPKSGYRWGPPGQMSTRQTPQALGITEEMLASGWSSERHGRLKRCRGPFSHCMAVPSHTILPSVPVCLGFCLPQIGLIGLLLKGQPAEFGLGFRKGESHQLGIQRSGISVFQGLLSLSFPSQRMEIIMAIIITIIFSLGTRRGCCKLRL